MKAYRKVFIIAFIYFALLNLFEAAQQYYYIVNFDLADTTEISFWGLLKNHAIRWVIWGIFAIPLTYFTIKNPIQKQSLNSRLLLKYSVYILLFLFATLSLISLFQLLASGDGLSGFWESFAFFAFQKSALFVNAYLGLIALVHLYLNYQELDLKVIELSDLKEQYQSLYTSLKEKTYQDSTPIIQIKIGNKVKAIPLSEIIWIQSDDYCVKVHTRKGKAYTLRKSMKAMEQELSAKGFIRIHRNSIVNREEIESCTFVNDPQIHLKNGVNLSIASSRVSKVRAMFKEPV